MALFLTLLTLLLGCAVTTRSGLLKQARAYHQQGEHALAMEQLDFLMTASEPPAEMRAEIIWTKASWLEERGEIRDAVFLYRYVRRRYPETEFARRATEQLLRISCNSDAGDVDVGPVPSALPDCPDASSSRCEPHCDAEGAS